jgi:hypothetical protein
LGKDFGLTLTPAFLEILSLISYFGSEPIISLFREVGAFLLIGE